MLKNHLIKAAFFIPIAFASCSLYIQNVPVDVLYINKWNERRVDFNPGGSYGFIAAEQISPNAFGKRINPAVEPAEEFTTALGRDGSLYLAYTTKINSSQEVRVDTVSDPAVFNTYTEVLESLTDIRSLTVTRNFKKSGTGASAVYTFESVSTNEPSPEGKVVSDKGVWVRLLRYDASRSQWSVEFATERPAEFSGLAIAFVPGRTLPYIAAVSNSNRLVVFGKPSAAENLSFIGNSSGTLDLNGGRNPGSVSQLSAFNDGDRLYISFIEDQKNVIGYVRGLKWQENYADIWPGRTPTLFSMAANQGEMYGVWWNSLDQVSTVSAYNTNATPNRRWLLVNNISATESPKIKSRYYTDFGTQKLDVYMGYVYGSTKFFQLSRIANNQIYTTAPPVDGYNDRYDFDIDSKGRVIYARINSGNTLDVGTWTRDIWRTAEQPQKILPEQTVTRTPYKTFPRSQISSIFVQGSKPYLAFIEDTGYLQLLEGVPSQGL